MASLTRHAPGLSASSQELDVEGLIFQLYLVVAYPSLEGEGPRLKAGFSASEMFNTRGL